MNQNTSCEKLCQNSLKLFFSVDLLVEKKLKCSLVSFQCQFVKNKTLSNKDKNSSKDVYSLSSESRVVIEIRQDYLLEVDYETKEIISGLQLSFEHSIKVMKNQIYSKWCQFQINQVYGICLKVSGLEEEITLVFQEQHHKIETFKKFLEELSQKNISFKDFHNDYKPVQKIGSGTTAIVYKAMRKSDKKLFAIKAFKKSIKQEKNHEKMKMFFFQQINILSILKAEDYICRFQRFYETQNTCYLVQDIYQFNMVVFLQRYGFPPFEITKKLMFKMLKGLESIHKNKIIHRDIKLENIMIKKNKNGQLDPIICDFGLAEYVETQKPLFVRCGTPGMIAPEIINGSEKQKLYYDEKSDIFSMGIIFYMLFFNKFLFEGSNVKQIYQKNKKCEISHFLSFQQYPELQENIKDLLRGMLSKNSSQRLSASQCINKPFFSKLINKTELI